MLKDFRDIPPINELLLAIYYFGASIVEDDKLGSDVHNVPVIMIGNNKAFLFKKKSIKRVFLLFS
jgi:hypothetical protein